MTPELILWIVGIAVAFCAIIAVFNHFENKQIRNRRRENDELAKKVHENISFFQTPRATKNPTPSRKNAIPVKPKKKTVQELKEEIGEASLINEKVTVDNEVVYETERLVEPEWADAMRESAEQASQSGITKEYVLGPHEHVIDPRLKYKDKPKTIDDRVRELALKKKGSKPFYKDENKKEWE